MNHFRRPSDEYRTDNLTDAMNYADAQINALGTKNGVLPSLQVFATLTNNGLNGVANQKSLPLISAAGSVL